MKMGAVIQKLQQRKEVATIGDGGDVYVILLAQGYASNGQVECKAKTAHEARLFIDAASNGTERVRRNNRVMRVVSADGNVTEIAATPVRVFKPSRMGPPCPIWLANRSFDAHEMWGRQAYLQGYGRDSNPFGGSSAGKVFDAAWVAEDKEAQRAAGKEYVAPAAVVYAAQPDEPLGDEGEVDMFVAEQAEAA